MGFIGSGKHRRPTQTERAVSAAGVAGAGLAIPLLAATSAHAAPVTTWDSVAQCASAGDWGRSTGNGAYGGLQLDLRTWAAYGGSQYAAQPDHATKEEQIAVAERVLEDRGARVWGACATTAGLTGEGRPEAAEPTAPATTPASTPAPTSQRTTSAPVFPGMAGLDTSSGIYWYKVDGHWYWTTSPEVYAANTGTTYVPSAPTTGTPGAVGTPGTPGTVGTPGTTYPGQGTTAPTTPAPTAPTTGTPADPTLPPVTGGTTTPLPGDTTAPTAPATTDPAGGTPAAPGTATTTDPAATTTTTPDTGTTPAPAQDTTYTVAPGDTLSGISNSHKLGGWKSVYTGNSSAIGEDPDLIKPGQVLTLD